MSDRFIWGFIFFAIFVVTFVAAASVGQEDVYRQIEKACYLDGKFQIGYRVYYCKQAPIMEGKFK